MLVNDAKAAIFIASVIPPAGADIRLGVVQSPLAKPFLESEPRVFALAARERDGHSPLDFQIGVRIERRNGLLEPVDIVRLNLARQPDRLDRRVGVVGVDGQLDVGTDDAAQRRRQLGVAFDSLADLHFHRPEPGFEIAAGFAFPALLQRLAAAEIKAGGVALDRLGRRAAEQPVERGSGRLRLDVPQGDVDCRKRGDQGAFAPVVDRARIEQRPQRLGIARVASDQQRPKKISHGRERERGGTVRLSPACESRIGGNPHEHGFALTVVELRETERPFERRAQVEGVNRRNAHGLQ